MHLHSPKKGFKCVGNDRIQSTFKVQLGFLLVRTVRVIFFRALCEFCLKQEVFCELLKEHLVYANHFDHSAPRAKVTQRLTSCLSPDTTP